MRYALISDIHGNLEAFEAVLGDLSIESIDKYLFAGDCVGYGANPKECIKALKSLNCAVSIAGNHEWGALGLLDLEYFSDYAREAVVRTKSVLDNREADYLRSFELLHEDASFTMVHGSLESPAEFNYIRNSREAAAAAKLMKNAVLFVGHTHDAGIFYFDSDEAGYSPGPRIKIDRDKKYVINVGSVGQPRDGDPRAAYALYDDSSGMVEIKRTAYDIEGAQKKILKAHLPAFFAERLSEGR